MPEVHKINLGLPPELKPQFVNMVRIAHTPGEFILDFTAILPGDEAPQVLSRIILSPLGLKLMQQAINENLRRYEHSFGEIHFPVGHTLADDLFTPGTPPDSGVE